MSRGNLSGFGELSEEDMIRIEELASRYHTEVRETYYDIELVGSVYDLERITLSMWSMSRDEWSENGLVYWSDDEASDIKGNQ